MPHTANYPATAAAAAAAMELDLVLLLRLAWAAGTLPIILASLPIPAGAALHRMIMGFAARGKTMPCSSSPSREFTVPQRYFLHFYVVAVVSTTCLLFSTWFYAYMEVGRSSSMNVKHKYQVWQTVFVLLLVEVQVLRRLHESLNVFNYAPLARMHIFGYLTGLFFYTAVPLSLCSKLAQEVLRYLGGQIAEFTVSGWGRMLDDQHDCWDFLEPLFKLGWCTWIGAAIFTWGWFHQLHSHAILGSLRKHKVSNEYLIPHGDWFAYVSCPHYLAELVIYAGILVATGLTDITIWLLFMFVVSNLVFAAAETHRWYSHKFENYPPRHAIIPFIY